MLIICLHTVKWFQVLLFNYHKYSYTIKIWPIDGTLTGTPIASQSGHGSNVSDGELCIRQISKDGTSSSDGLRMY